MPLDIVRPERAVLTGEFGLAQAIHRLRTGLGLRGPLLGEIKNACHPGHVEQLRGWLEEARQVARARLQFIGEYLITPRGHGAGEPFQLRPFQREIIRGRVRARYPVGGRQHSAGEWQDDDGCRSWVG